MEISIINLPDLEESNSTNELKDILGKSTKMSEYMKTRQATLIMDMLKDSSNDTLIVDINNLSQRDIIFIEGTIYNFSFTKPSVIYNGSIKLVVNQNVGLKGIAIPEEEVASIPSGGKYMKGGNHIQFLGTKYIPIIVKTPEEFVGLIYNLSNQSSFYNQTLPVTILESNVINVFPPLYKTPMFGFGERADHITCTNLGITSEAEAKSFKILPNREPIERFKKKLIEAIFLNKFGHFKPFDKIPDQQKLYEEFLTKKDQVDEAFAIKVVIDDTLSFEHFQKQLAGIGDANRTLDRDIYFKSKELIRVAFKTENPSFIKEVSRIVDIILKKKMLQMEKSKIDVNEKQEAQFELLKYLYIVVSLHHIQHAFSIPIAGENPTQYFIKLLFEKAKNPIDKSGLSRKMIEENYYKGLIKVDVILNENNLSLESRTVKKDPFSWQDTLEFICAGIEGKGQIRNMSKEPTKGDSKETYPLITSIYKALYTPNFIEPTRQYSPSILSIVHPFTHADPRFNVGDISKKLGETNLLSFEIKRFYNYYTNGCPKGVTHEWLNNKCKLCSVTKEMIEELDKKYYQIYKGDFDKYKKEPEIMIIKPTKIPPVNDLASTTFQFLKGKIDDIISKYKTTNLKIPLINLTRNESIKLIDAKTKVIESDINMNHIHKLKYYLSNYHVPVDVFNNVKSNEDLFISMFFVLVSKLDKENLEDLINLDLTFAHQEIEDILMKNKKTVATNNYEATFDIDDEKPEVEEEDDEGVDFNGGDDDANPDS
jgi:hypothetical protein